MKRLVYLFIAATIAGSGLIVKASQNPTQSEKVRLHNSNNNSSDLKFVKKITALSRMGTVDKYDLYRDADNNFCVLSKNEGKPIPLEIYNQDGWSHTFRDLTTWFCNVYR